MFEWCGAVVRGMPRSQPHDTFDYDEWAESVDGKTLYVTAWRGTRAERVAPSVARPTYCAECDGEVMLLIDDEIGGEKVGHCPACGNLPGLHETEREDDPRITDSA